MNDLSWLLYIAGIIDNFASFFLVFGVIASFIFLVGLLTLCLSDPDEEDVVKKSKVIMKVSGPVATVFCLVASFIPGENTIYLIAGSEMTEEAVMSETGQEVLDYLRNAVTHQLKELSE